MIFPINNMSIFNVYDKERKNGNVTNPMSQYIIVKGGKKLKATVKTRT